MNLYVNKNLATRYVKRAKKQGKCQELLPLTLHDAEKQQSF